jgi:hypothetical protein
MRDLLGLAVTTLRCVRTDYERNVYAMELHSRDWLPPAGAGWFAADQIAGLPLMEPDHRALLRDWFAWNAASAVPANRPPWYMPGWFAEASEWIQAQLGRLGMRLTAPIEQLRVTVVATGLGRPAAAARPPLRERETAAPARDSREQRDTGMRVVARPRSASDYAAYERPTAQRQARAVGDGLRPEADAEDVLDIPAFLRRQAD